MEKPLYKSVGMSSGSYRTQMFVSIIIGIIGIFVLFSCTVSRSLFDYLLNNSKLKLQHMIIIGLLLVVVSIFEIATTIMMNKSKLYVYTDHIEGVSSSKWLPFTKNFNLKYNQITNVKYICRWANRYIYLYANGVKHTVPISSNIQEAYEVVNRQMLIR